MTEIQGCRWVMMDGPAGAGKSTLAGALARKLRAADHRADVFGEEELFTREEFAEVAEGFRTKEFAGPAAFEAAYSAYLSRFGSGWAVFDWSAAAMTGDLGWERTAYVEHLRRVTHLDPDCSLILLSLRIPARMATKRAANQRGEEWLNRYDKIALSEGFEGADQVERITARAEYQLVLAEAERAAVREAGWTVVDIDASRAADLVAQQAFAGVRRS